MIVFIVSGEWHAHTFLMSHGAEDALIPWVVGGILRITMTIAVAAGTFALTTACSKSPTDLAVDAANTVGKRLMEPVMQRDASAQARYMADLITNRPECTEYRNRMPEAARGSPYEGATQLKFVQTQQDADKAACIKPR